MKYIVKVMEETEDAIKTAASADVGVGGSSQCSSEVTHILFFLDTKLLL